MYACMYVYIGGHYKMFLSFLNATIKTSHPKIFILGDKHPKFDPKG